MLYLIIIKSSSVISRVVKLKHPQRDQPVNMCIIKCVVVVVEQALSEGVCCSGSGAGFVWGVVVVVEHAVWGGGCCSGSGAGFVWGGGGGGSVVVVEQYLNCRAPLIALAMAALKTCGTPSLMDHERGEMTER